MVFQGPIVAVLAVYWLRRSAGHCFFSNYDVTCTGRHIPPVVFFFFFILLRHPPTLFVAGFECVFKCTNWSVKAAAVSCFPHLLPSSEPFRPRACHSVWLLEACADVFGDHPSALDSRPPPPPLLTHSFSTCVVLLFSAIPKHTDSFFSAIVPADECLALLQFRRVGDKLN